MFKIIWVYISKYLLISFEEELNFLEHINKIVEEKNEINNVIKISLSLQRSSLITIYKFFIIPFIDYGNIIYDQPNNPSFSDNI